KKYGVLSEGIQVKAAIVLADIQRNGIMIDRIKAQNLRMRWEKRLLISTSKLMENAEFGGLFKFNSEEQGLILKRKEEVESIDESQQEVAVQEDNHLQIRPKLARDKLEELLLKARHEISNLYNRPDRENIKPANHYMQENKT